MNQIVSDEVCQYTKSSSVGVYANHATAIDPKILESCKLLNQLPGIAVRWSCEGHYPHKVENTVEIVTVVTENGLSALHHLHGILKTKLDNDKVLQRHAVALLTRDLLTFTPETVWLPNWHLVYYLPRVEKESDLPWFCTVQDQYISILETTLQELVNGL